ncbi:MAG: class I SAM-dependent DNA methyltransferase [Rhodothermales bacterium]
MKQALSPEADGRPVPPYSALAAGYDVVMAHVDYEAWAAYAYRLLRKHHAGFASVVELACGTGSFAIALQQRGPYRYLATDCSPQMLAIAREKAVRADVPIEFAEADVMQFHTEEPFDVLILLYDSINYLLDEADVRQALDRAYAALRPGGVLLFDQSTPSNSINNEAYFEDEGGEGAFTYVRQSRYDRETRLHTTQLVLDVGDERFHEEHVHHAYARETMCALLAQTPFAEEAAYDGMTTAPATRATERIHWIARRPG